MQERLSNWSLARQGPSCTTLLFDCSADTTLPRLGGVLRCSPLSNPHNSEWKRSSGQSWSSVAWRWNFVVTLCGTHQFLGTPTLPDYHHVFNLCSRWDFYIIEIWLLLNSTNRWLLVLSCPSCSYPGSSPSTLLNGKISRMLHKEGEEGLFSSLFVASMLSSLPASLLPSSSPRSTAPTQS